MDILYIAAGAVLILVALRDIFHTLFHPEGHGGMSDYIAYGVWRSFRATGSASALNFAGPFAFLAVVTTWAALMLLGWALVYTPYIPEYFRFASGIPAETKGGFDDALYLSAVTLTTLGYGDLTPTTVWIRFLAPFEALLGFAIFTASVSWLLSLYPALSRRRAVAHELTLLREALGDEGAPNGDGSEAFAHNLRSMTEGLIRVRGDLSQFPITYYFRDPDERAALPIVLPFAARVAEEFEGEGSPSSVRLNARALRGALGDLAERLDRNFLKLPDRASSRAFTEYARDHMREPL